MTGESLVQGPSEEPSEEPPEVPAEESPVDPQELLDRPSTVTDKSTSTATASKTLSSPVSPSWSSLSYGTPMSSLSDNHDYLDIFGDEHPEDNEKTLPTFKLVGDNLDKSVRPRDMRLDNQTQSLHYFHMYGVHDRINLAQETDNPSLAEVAFSDLKAILPTSEDQESLRKNFSFLIACVLKKHIPFFN